MIGRIVEIAENGRYLCVHRGFMLVMSKGEEIGRVALDDIAAVIANAHGLSYSNNLLLALAERNALMVICGPNHAPAAFLWSVEGHHRQSGRLDAQLAASLPRRKQLWKQIVQAKLAYQAAVLEALEQPHAPLTALIRKVRSGDPENIEAQGARRYWGLLFGKEFRRDRDAEGANSLLNYGYTILRSATARSVLAVGLHPGIELNHSNNRNALRLVDDLMEPFRPLVDMAVQQLLEQGVNQVQADSKRILAKLMYRDLATDQGATPVISCLHRLALSLAQVYEKQRETLDIPNPPTALELQSLIDE